MLLIDLSVHLLKDEGIGFQYEEGFLPTNVMDKWILSFTQSLMVFVKEEMKSTCM